MVSNTKPNVIDKDNVIKKLKKELIKTKKLLACSDKNRNILYQRLDLELLDFLGMQVL